MVRKLRLFDLPPDKSAATLPAQRLLTASGETGAAIDVAKLSRMVGIRKITEVPMVGAHACLIPDRYGYTVMVDQALPTHHQRSSIAHEIGHVLLQARSRKYRRLKVSTDQEFRCDMLAAELLMPTEAFSTEMAEREASLSWIEVLARTFGVPVEFAALRFAWLSASGVSATCWRRDGFKLSEQWSIDHGVANAKPRVRNQVEFGDYSHHAVRAFTSGRLAVVRPNDERSQLLQSKRFGTPFAPYVITLAQTEA